ncbi:MAG: ImmA/IrrE family metallo-endopeptidase [Lachnospiraceae bacterium]|nr:ImmA/IrrE family metallo-endopeptidase [Lachnospiraceae bacterium]
MDAGTRVYINNVTQRIMDGLEVQTPLENIDELVERLGGRISSENALIGDTDGKVYKTQDASFVIEISPTQSFERRNFTIAHELGHLFLHMGYLTSPKTWECFPENVPFERKGNSEEEYQANEFAAALLMPKNIFIQKVNEYAIDGFVDMKKVAEYFRVSPSAAVNRGRFLRIIS